MNEARRISAFRAADFFVLRAAAWPFDRFAAWSDGLAVPSSIDGEALVDACRRDRAVLAARLAAIGRDPAFRVALRVAAPDLESHLDDWLAQGAPPGRVAAAVTRYFTRMTTRPTPFGLFAGWGPGSTGETSRLHVSGAGSLRTRLDAEVLEAIAAQTAREPDVAPHVRYEPNDSLVAVAGRLRYVAVTGTGERRTHVLCAAEPDAPLTATLARAAHGATAEELEAPLAREHEVPIEDARAFVAELIARQILVASCRPSVTTTDALADLTRELPAESMSRTRLEELRPRLRAVDTAAPDARRGAIEEAAALALDLAGGRGRRDALQVDLRLDTSAVTLAPAVLAEVERAARVLERIAPPGPREMERFRVAFRERYEGEEIPLAEALDPEIGVGFGPVDPRAEAAPWLAGLDFPELSEPGERPLERLHDLLGRVPRAAGIGVEELVLEEADLDALGDRSREPLPDAFSILATLVAHSEAALDAGEFRILVDSVFGPSGARLLGRFADADPALRAAIDRHLLEEEALRPDVVFAEVVHVPEGRLGNVIGRPPFRAWEIPFLGRSGVPSEHRLPISDLTVSLEGPRVVLRSRRLGREIQPRITNAHNYRLRSLPLYRFLGTLQSQGRLEYGAWDWGRLARMPRLPRVTCGKLVLARGRWRVSPREFAELARGTDAERMRAVRRWRETCGIPRRAVLADLDHRLLVDFEDLASLEAFLPLVTGRGPRILEEEFPEGEDLVVRSPEGAHVHEVLVPFVRTAPLAEAGGGVMRTSGAASPRGSTPARRASIRRVFAPGSEWLYARLFTGPASADTVLCRVVAPLVTELDAASGPLHWFFLRYADPDWHLRLRVHGKPAWLREAVLPALDARLAPLLEERTVWRVAHDTYRREVERYGGPDGMLHAESLFECDSRWALAVLGHLAGDDAAEVRTLALLFGLDRRLAEFSLDSAGRRAVLSAAREGIARSLGVDRTFERQLDASFRTRRSRVEDLLASGGASEPGLAPAVRAWEHLAGRGASTAAAIAGLAAEGRLAAAFDSVVTSHLHMLSNRVLRGAHAEQELLLYDTLLRVATSQEARRRRLTVARSPSA